MSSDMLLYLLLSILSSTCLLIILKSYIRWKVETLHGIIFNYLTAASLAFFLNPSAELDLTETLSPVWPFSLGIGFMFISVFYITARTTQLLGVGIASIASKMSMVIPIVSGLILYNESLGIMKAAGLLLALPAVVITSYPSGQNESAGKFNLSMMLLPLLLFLGAGLVDAAIKAAQHYFMNEQNQYLIIMSIFGSAGLFGLLRLGYEMLILKKMPGLRSVAGGILLGVTNYLSLYFLLKCLAAPGSESSTVFAFVNIGVVITSFLTGVMMFNEKPDKNKLIGLALAVVAIIILAAY